MFIIRSLFRCCRVWCWGLSLALHRVLGPPRLLDSFSPGAPGGGFAFGPRFSGLIVRPTSVWASRFVPPAFGVSPSSRLVVLVATSARLRTCRGSCPSRAPFFPFTALLVAPLRLLRSRLVPVVLADDSLSRARVAWALLPVASPFLAFSARLLSLLCPLCSHPSLHPWQPLGSCFSQQSAGPYCRILLLVLVLWSPFLSLAYGLSLLLSRLGPSAPPTAAAARDPYVFRLPTAFPRCPLHRFSPSFFGPWSPSSSPSFLFSSLFVLPCCSFHPLPPLTPFSPPCCRSLSLLPRCSCAYVQFLCLLFCPSAHSGQLARSPFTAPSCPLVFGRFRDGLGPGGCFFQT